MPKLKYSICVGDRFGRLTVIAVTHPDIPREYLCKCECGTEKIIDMYRLNTRNVNSCGCAKRYLRNGQLKHGMSKSRLYSVWTGMRDRCERTSNRSYKYYGARGIKVCEKWQDFLNFQKDMQNTHRPNLQLDRINNDGDYCPENCRWVSPQQNIWNSRSTKIIELDGKKKPLPEWAEIFNIPATKVRSRIWRGWTIEEALEIKPRILLSSK